MKRMTEITDDLNTRFMEMMSDYDDVMKRMRYSKTGAYKTLVLQRRTYIPESGEYGPVIPKAAAEVRFSQRVN